MFDAPLEGTTYEDDDSYEDGVDDEENLDYTNGINWKNREGESLADFGVEDEDVDYLNDEDIPLAMLIQRRKKAGL
jgi:hypothetical protein